MPLPLTAGVSLPCGVEVTEGVGDVALGVLYRETTLRALEEGVEGLLHQTTPLLPGEEVGFLGGEYPVIANTRRVEPVLVIPTELSVRTVACV